MISSNVQDALNKASIAEHSGNTTQAIEAYQRVLSFDAHHPGALLRLVQLTQPSRDVALTMLSNAITAARTRGLGAQAFPIHSDRIILLREADPQTRLHAIKDAERDCGEVPGLIWEECECLKALGRLRARMLRLNRLAALQPNDPVVLAELGLALVASNSAAQAIKPLRRAIELGMSDPELAISLATVEMLVRDFTAAATRLDAVLLHNPEHLGALGLRWHLAMQCCDWINATPLESRLGQLIERGHAHGALAPGRLQASRFNALLLKRYAQSYAALPSSDLPSSHNSAPKKNTTPQTSDAPPGARIRIGYLSSDFHTHATAILLAGVIEQHDRARFETFAYSYGSQTADPYRSRLQAAFDHWHDVNELSDDEAAALIASNNIDVLLELKGHTLGPRPAIAAQRPARIQAHHLGYPGTLEMAGVDYFIGDEITNPAESDSEFCETIIRLPRCYQPNDQRRARPAPRARDSIALPENAIVLCNFNQSWKWQLPFVQVWMTALKKHANAVLWLLDPGAEHPAKKNLERYAETFGVASKILWAPRLPPDEHLTRLACADLALDSLPCHSHTTAADALWMGVPLITQMGDRFDGRVAASLLRAAGLASLVTHSTEDYANLLDQFLSDASFRRAIGAQAKRAHESALFDTAAYTRDFEAMIELLVNRS